jgi:transcriptional regulator with XRE-family HTH domain
VSAVVRRRLASELRRLRDAANLTCEDVAVRLECSSSKISRIETGRVLVTPRDVRELAQIYGVLEDERDRLVQLARESRQQGWLQTFGYSLPAHVATYVDMESAAAKIRIYRGTRLYSLLQTPDYSEAIVAAAGAASVGRGGAQDPTAEVRAERQRLARTTPQAIQAVLDEAALLRQVGGPEVMRGQIEHLIEMSAAPITCIQVIPFSSGTIPVDLPFVVLSFPDPADPDVVCVRYPTGMLWIEDTAEVEVYRALFGQLQASALSPEESVALMTAVLKNGRKGQSSG